MKNMLSTLALLTTTFTGTFAFATEGTYDPSNPVDSNAAIFTAIDAAVNAINSIDARDAAGNPLATHTVVPTEVLNNNKPGAYKKEIEVVTLSVSFEDGLKRESETTDIVAIDADWKGKLVNLQNIVYLGLVGTQTPINDWTGTDTLTGVTGGLAVVYNQVVSDINDNAALQAELNIGASGDFAGYATTLERIDANIVEFNKAWDEVVAVVNSVNPVKGITVVGLDTTNLSDDWAEVAQ